MTNNTEKSMILREYSPAECDNQGLPLDWFKCQWCRGSGSRLHRPQDGGGMHVNGPKTCPDCDGQGSLRAAALMALWKHDQKDTGSGICVEGPSCPVLTHKARCEGCGHPMSDGEWEGLEVSEELVIANAEEKLELGSEPHRNGVHYSPCDERCRHQGPSWLEDGTSTSAGRLKLRRLGVWKGTGEPYEGTIKASWRIVDIRVGMEVMNLFKAGISVYDVTEFNNLDVWHLRPWDLRRENVALLCLRCWVET